jgi:hypothetical protein
MGQHQRGARLHRRGQGGLPIADWADLQREEQRKYDEEIRAKYAADGANKP